MSSPESEPVPGCAPAVFRLRSVEKVYGQGAAAVHALRDVTLDVLRGEFMVMLGPSGSGKSTLLNLMGGLDRPSGGELKTRE